MIPPTNSFNKFCSIVFDFYMWILCCSKEWRMLPTSTQAPMKAFLPECPFRASSCRPVLGCHRFNAFTRGNLSAGHLCNRIHMFLFRHSQSHDCLTEHHLLTIYTMVYYVRVFHEARHLWPKFILLKNLKTEPPKTFSQNPLVVSL